MNPREWINNNAAMVTILAALVTVFALMYIFFSSGKPKGQQQPIPMVL